MRQPHDAQVFTPLLNDEALAASIEQWKAQDVSYQRAQNEEQREQIEGAYRATQRRLAAAKQQIKDRGAMETHSRIRRTIRRASGWRCGCRSDGRFPPNWTPERLRWTSYVTYRLRQKVQNQRLPQVSRTPRRSAGERWSSFPANTLAMQQQTQVQRGPRLSPMVLFISWRIFGRQCAE
jgi:hypothetical protein